MGLGVRVGGSGWGLGSGLGFRVGFGAGVGFGASVGLRVPILHLAVLSLHGPNHLIRARARVRVRVS